MTIMIEQILMGFVKNPEFIFDCFCMSISFKTEFSEEFSFELIDKSSIEYDFITSCLL